MKRTKQSQQFLLNFLRFFFFFVEMLSAFHARSTPFRRYKLNIPFLYKRKATIVALRIQRVIWKSLFTLTLTLVVEHDPTKIL